MAYEISIMELAGQRTVSVKATVIRSEFGPKYGEMLGEVMGYLADAGRHPAGPPFARFLMRQDDVDLEAGFPVAEELPGEAPVTAGELPAGRAVTTLHVGPYEELGHAHEAVMGWIKEQGLQHAGLPWEVYLTDPEAEPDPTKWVTQVVYPVA